jgi:argininosuccinate synthase
MRQAGKILLTPQAPANTFCAKSAFCRQFISPLTPTETASALRRPQNCALVRDIIATAVVECADHGSDAVANG